jgi:hypothetical protein
MDHDARSGNRFDNSPVKITRRDGSVLLSATLQVIRPEPAEMGKDTFASIPLPANNEVPLFPHTGSFNWPPAVSQTEHTFRAYTLRKGADASPGCVELGPDQRCMRHDLAS